MADEQEYFPFNLGEFPDVPLLKIFSFLGIKDRVRCSQVCRKWNHLIFTPSVWRTLNILTEENEKGDYYDSQSQSKRNIYKGWILLDGGYIKILDDIDSDDEDCFEKSEILMYRNVISEYKLLIGCLESVLPQVGHNVKKLSIFANSGLSDFIFNLYLILCPNIEYLDARYNCLTSDAFRELNVYGSCQKIKSLNLMGCKQVTDKTLYNLTTCWNSGYKPSSKEEKRTIAVPYTVQLARYVCSEIVTAEDLVFEGFFSNSSEIKSKTFTCPQVNFSYNKYSSGLKCLCLAGCTRITDRGLKFLAKCNYVSGLELLDVSGCSGLTSAGLNMLTESCPKLKASNLYYCDMISDGPFYKEANGCQTEGGVCCMY